MLGLSQLGLTSQRLWAQASSCAASGAAEKTSSGTACMSSAPLHVQSVSAAEHSCLLPRASIGSTLQAGIMALGLRAVPFRCLSTCTGHTADAHPVSTACRKRCCNTGCITCCRWAPLQRSLVRTHTAGIHDTQQRATQVTPVATNEQLQAAQLLHCCSVLSVCTALVPSVQHACSQPLMALITMQWMALCSFPMAAQACGAPVETGVSRNSMRNR